MAAVKLGYIRHTAPSFTFWKYFPKVLPMTHGFCGAGNISTTTTRTDAGHAHPCPYTYVHREIAQEGETESLSDDLKNIKLGKVSQIDQEQKHRAL